MRVSYRVLQSGACLTLVLFIAACADTPPSTIASVPTPMSNWASGVDTLPGTYTGLSSATEFSHGVIVTTDLIEKLVWRLDVDARARRVLSARGGGPGEYDSPVFAVNIGHDSVALLGNQDPTFPVISVTTGRGRTHRLPHRFAPSRMVTGSLSAGEPTLQYADTLGHIYGAPTVTAPVANPHSGRRDLSTMRVLESIPVVRYSLVTGRVDTLEYVPRGVAATPTTRDGNVRTRGMELGSYGAFNSWSVTSDGHLVIANAAQYTLKVSDAAGPDTLLAQWRITGNVIPVSASSWDAYIKKATTGSTALIARMNATLFSRIGKAPPIANPTRYIVPPKPRVLPYLSFADGKRRMHESEGVVWVPVHVTDPPGPQYWDIINLATGQRLSTVALPPNEYLMTVTARGAYVMASDQDDQERLLLYRHPNASPTAYSRQRR